MKTCRECDIEKTFDKFYKHEGSKGGLACNCKVCHNKLRRERYNNPKTPEGKAARHAYHKNVELKDPRYKSKIREYTLKRQYGITLADFNDMMKSQNDCCSLCKEEFKSTKETHVDHCHLSGEVRSILCHHCNTGLGKFQDNPARLREAADYLERHQREHTNV